MLEWKRIRKHRHLVFEGRPLCGVFGGYDEDPALPCEVCLDMLRKCLETAVMSEENWEELEND